MTLFQELKRRNVVRVGIACALARIPELKVSARTSAFSYKGSDATIAQIRGSSASATCWKAACASRATPCG